MEGPKKTARFSFMGFKPILTFSSKHEDIMINDERLKSSNPYDCLRRVFNHLGSSFEHNLPFTGGLVGYISYDMVRFFERIPAESKDDLDYPDSYFILPSVIVCYDHLEKEVYSISREKDLENSIETEQHFGELSIGKAKQNMTQEYFEESVRKAKEYILDGDIFQVVLSRRSHLLYKGDKLRIYQTLRNINPSPYMFFLDFEDHSLIGSSPEMLVQLRGRELTTKPIAGTRPRSPDPEEDEKLKVEMFLDPKERAEHVMLVDLHRNDLGRVSEYGTVKVDQFMDVEKFSHVQHIVSRVRGIIRPKYSGFDALKASFPAGTVSGAPKIRAMEIIDELEPTQRGPYAGVVGYFDLNGNIDFAITIRSIFTKCNSLYIQAGAGIVADSNPEREFFETEHKMEAMVHALGGVEN